MESLSQLTTAEVVDLYRAFLTIKDRKSYPIYLKVKREFYRRMLSESVCTVPIQDRFTKLLTVVNRFRSKTSP